MDIVLQNSSSYPEVRARCLRRWLLDLVPEVAPSSSSFGVRFVGLRAIVKLNRDFREMEGVTDVLSFPGSNTPDGRHLGDVVVCVPAARAAAQEQGHSIDLEIRRLLLHGVLHCLGFDHEGDGGEMEMLEEKLRLRWLEQ